MEPLDGNAIAGQLEELFGADMTTADGVCAHCGAESLVAELIVYFSGPGAVVRCRRCGQVVIVLATIGAHVRIDRRGLDLRPAWPAVIGPG